MRKLLTAAAVALALGATACGNDPEEDDVRDVTAEEEPAARAMPCGEDEVYVWVDFEADEAKCVASDDHERHDGHEG